MAVGSSSSEKFIILRSAECMLQSLKPKIHWKKPDVDLTQDVSPGLQDLGLNCLPQYRLTAIVT